MQYKGYKICCTALGAIECCANMLQNKSATCCVAMQRVWI